MPATAGHAGAHGGHGGSSHSGGGGSHQAARAPGRAGNGAVILPARGFDLPSLLYTTLAVAFGLYAMGEVLRAVVELRNADEILTMEVMAPLLLSLGAATAIGALVFGGCFGRGLPGWARVALVSVAALLVVLRLGAASVPAA